MHIYGLCWRLVECEFRFCGKSTGEEGGDAKPSPDVRHLLCHLACPRLQPDYTFIPPEWQMCPRCPGRADVPHCAFSPFFGHTCACATSFDHMEMKGALTFPCCCQLTQRGDFKIIFKLLSRDQGRNFRSLFS